MAFVIFDQSLLLQLKSGRIILTSWLQIQVLTNGMKQHSFKGIGKLRYVNGSRPFLKESDQLFLNGHEQTLKYRHRKISKNI